MKIVGSLFPIRDRYDREGFRYLLREVRESQNNAILLTVDRFLQWDFRSLCDAYMSQLSRPVDANLQDR